MSTRDNFTVRLIIITGIVAALSGILGNIAAGLIPEDVKPFLWLAWPLFFLFTLFGISLAIWQSLQDRRLRTDDTTLIAYSSNKEDWGEAPDIREFVGRKKELHRAERWITSRNCQIIGIFGIGGVGKTIFVTKLANEIKDSFEHVIWRSLRNAPPLEDFLIEIVGVISDKTLDTKEQVTLALVSSLQQRRCLLIIDNLESVMKTGEHAGHFEEGYEDFGEIIRRLGETKHQSCILITSREKPKAFSLVENITTTRAIHLDGLDSLAGKQVLRGRGLIGSKEDWNQLVESCSGNPLMLKLIAESIRELFFGNIRGFLEEGLITFDGVHDLIQHQFERLTATEQSIIFYLTIYREPLSLDELFEMSLHRVPKHEILGLLSSLSARSIIERISNGFSLQNVIMEFATRELIEKMANEILAERINLLNSHPLLIAQAKVYIQEWQVRIILRPMLEKVVTLAGKEPVENIFRKFLKEVPNSPILVSGYAGGNILNILIQMGSDIKTFDFKESFFRQVNLQNLDLQDVDFSRAHFENTFFTETFGSILTVAYSSDGELLAVGGFTGEITVWNIKTGEKLHKLKGHTNWVRGIAFSPDGTILASASSDQSVRLWNVDSGKLKHLIQGHGDRVRAVAFVPTGSILASSGDDGTARLWNTDTGQNIAVFSGHIGPVLSVSISPDGKFLVSCGEDKSIRIWSIGAGNCLLVLNGHSERVNCIAISRDGNLLASGSDDYTVRIWKMLSGECIKVLQGHSDCVSSIAFNIDGRILASASYDTTIRMWDLFAHDPALRTLHGHTSWVRSIAFSPDGTVVASGSEDRTVRLWNVTSSQCIRIYKGFTNPVWSIALSPDGQIMISGNDDHTVKVWDIVTGSLQKTMFLHASRVWSVALSPQIPLAASGGEDGLVVIWDLEKGAVIHRLEGHNKGVWSVAFSPSGLMLASAGEDCTIRLWDLRSGGCVGIITQDHPIRSVAFSSDNLHLVSGGNDHLVRVWNIENIGSPEKLYNGHNNWVWSVAISPDGKFAASAGEDRAIHLWDLQSGQHVRQFIGHDDRVNGVAFSNGGKSLLSGSGDLTLRIWDVDSGDCLKTLYGHTGWIRAVSCNDRFVIASASYDGTIRLWDGESNEPQRILISDRPYERMNITAVTGLSAAQISTLYELGAFAASPE